MLQVRAASWEIASSDGILIDAMATIAEGHRNQQQVGGRPQ